MARHAAAAVLLCMALCAGVARAQAGQGEAPAAPAGDHITLTVTNACDKTILAAVVAANMQGQFEAQGFWRLAPGETAEAAKTTDRSYFVYGHELGDPECTLGCWSGNSEKELQGEPWPFMEKQMSPAVPLGGTVNHKFTC